MSARANTRHGRFEIKARGSGKQGRRSDTTVQRFLEAKALLEANRPLPHGERRADVRRREPAVRT